MSQKLPVKSFQLVEDPSEFDEGFIKSCNKKSKEKQFIEVEVQYPENLHNLQNNLQFLPERMSIEKVENFVANLHIKNEYVIHKRNLKQALNHRLVLKNGKAKIVKQNENS